MANCELSNLGLEFGEKIKENEKVAGGGSGGKSLSFQNHSLRVEYWEQRQQRKRK